MGWALRGYILAAHLTAPLWHLSVRRRAARGKEDPTRLSERFGHASAARPAGPLLWVHALGIGEATAMLSVIRAVRLARPDVPVLLTTNTKTGADGLARQGLPDGVIHQYAPVDTAGSVRRFLDHWQPDLLLLAELDLWPLMLSRLSAKRKPVIMANARLTDHRFAGRQRMRRLMRDLLAMVDQMLVQDETSRDRLLSLGADPSRVEVAGLLKAAADPLPDGADRPLLLQAIGARPRWLAASTDARELPTLIAAHRLALRERPDLLLILAPRQLTEADAAARALQSAFGSCPRRSAGTVPGRDDAVFLADSMGEMGLWYRLSPVSFIGHSLSVDGRPLTGKNPFEAVSLGSAVLHGPCVGNFAESYATLAAAGAAAEVGTAADLSAAVLDLIQNNPKRAEMVGAGQRALAQSAAALPRTVQAVLGHLPHPAVQ